MSRLPFGLSYGAFAIGIFLIGNFVMVDSPRFPESSGVDPKKALENLKLEIRAVRWTENLRFLFVSMSSTAPLTTVSC